MKKYTFLRILSILPTLLGATTLIFFMIHLIPGDPVLAILQEHFNNESYEIVRARLGLDRPLHEQYISFLYRVASGDLGVSFRSRRPVMENVLSVLPFTLHLAAAGFFIALAIAIPVGVISALRRASTVDTLAVLGVLLGVSTPSFFLGLLLIIVFSVYLGWFPPLGAGNPSNLRSLLHHLVLPATTVGLLTAATQARIVRSALLDVLHQDYVRTAWAKGLTERAVVLRHALRNALIPVITVAGMDFLSLLGGTTIIEIVFSRPGLGKLLVNAIAARDYPQIQGSLLAYIVLVLIINLLIDIAYGFVDPRVSYG